MNMVQHIVDLKYSVEQASMVTRVIPRPNVPLVRANSRRNRCVVDATLVATVVYTRPNIPNPRVKKISPRQYTVEQPLLVVLIWTSLVRVYTPHRYIVETSLVVRVSPRQHTVEQPLLVVLIRTSLVRVYTPHRYIVETTLVVRVSPRHHWLARSCLVRIRSMSCLILLDTGK